MHFVVTDDTMDREVFNIYLYSHDGCGNEFLPGLDPSKIYGKNILTFSEKYNDLMNRILEESDFDECPLELCLEPMTNGKETIYRIVDTELLI